MEDMGDFGGDLGGFDGGAFDGDLGSWDAGSIEGDIWDEGAISDSDWGAIDPTVGMDDGLGDPSLYETPLEDAPYSITDPFESPSPGDSVGDMQNPWMGDSSSIPESGGNVPGGDLSTDMFPASGDDVPLAPDSELSPLDDVTPPVDEELATAGQEGVGELVGMTEEELSEEQSLSGEQEGGLEQVIEENLNEGEEGGLEDTIEDGSAQEVDWSEEQVGGPDEIIEEESGDGGSLDEGQQEEGEPEGEIVAENPVEGESLTAEQELGQEEDLDRQGSEEDEEAAETGVTEQGEGDQNLDDLTAEVIDETVDPNDLQDRLGKDTIWDDDPFTRGHTFEDLEGNNLDSNFPAIDDFDPETGIATSSKTMDLNADSYESASAVSGKIEEYIDDLDEFDGTTWTLDGVNKTVDAEDIEGKELVVGIPAGSASAEQLEALRDCKDYAEEKGITLVIKEVP